MTHEKPCQRLVSLLLLFALIAGCEKAKMEVSEGVGPSPTLPAANRTMFPTMNIARAVGWREGARPIAAPGIQSPHSRQGWITRDGCTCCRMAMSWLPNRMRRRSPFRGIRGLLAKWAAKRAGAAVPSANRITLLRDTDHDGVADVRTVFLSNLYSPFGMALVGNDFYVANADALLRFPYQEGDNSIPCEGVKVTDLPAGINYHWTKNVIASRDGSKLYVTVGSNSNATENGDIEKDRAAIWEVNRASGATRLFATGLRNPNGMDWEPETGKLWVAVNERDEIGSDLVPDYITAVQEGGFYGWPYSYYGQHEDTRVRPHAPGARRHGAGA